MALLETAIKETQEAKGRLDSEGVRIAPEPEKKQSRFFRKNKSIYGDQLICLAALLFMAIWRSGFRALIICLVSVIVAMLADYVCCRLSKKVYNAKDLSTIVCGMGLAMMMPASVGYGYVVFGACLAMGVKHIFGGKDNYIFNPTCLSVAFLVICYPAVMLLYPPVGEQLPLFGEITSTLSSGMESYLVKLGTAQEISALDVLLGNFLGAMGTTHVLVLSVCGVCLMFRRALSPIVTFTAFGAFLLGSIIFPTYDNIFAVTAVELISGNMLFGLVFLASDPQTLPKSVLGKVYYGVVIGVLAVIFRHLAKTEASFVFVLLLANAISIHVDRFADKTINLVRHTGRSLKKALGNFERVKTEAQSETTKSLNDTQEIIVPLMNYNMPAIDNKIVKAKRTKPNFAKSERKTPFEKLRKEKEEPQPEIKENEFFKELKKNMVTKKPAPEEKPPELTLPEPAPEKKRLIIRKDGKQKPTEVAETKQPEKKHLIIRKPDKKTGENGGKKG